MRVTRAADIGLRALMLLAGEPERRTTIAELAEELSVPERHLGKVVQQLATSQWILTTRGRGGGIQISEKGRTATAADVLRLIEGERPPIDCYEPPCPLATRDCRLRGLLGTAQAAFDAELARVTMADLAGPLTPGSGTARTPLDIFTSNNLR